MDGRRALATAVAVSLAASVASCGSGETEPTEGSQNEPVGNTNESSPFRMGQEPAGHRLVQAGQGTLYQEWGEDSFGTDEPVTVLAPVGEGPGGPEEVRVSVTGFTGYQGGLAQASSGYLDEQREDFELDGQPAIYMPAHEEDGEAEPADLVTVVDDDLAVRVSTADATRDELVDIASTVEPQNDHLLAPLVPDPPSDLEVVGSADADVAISLLARPAPASERLPSGERGHTAVWARGEETDAWSSNETVVVTTLPGTALDLDALAATWPRAMVEHTTITPSEVAGRPATVLDLAGPEAPDNARRAVITSTAGGDLLLVTAHGPEPPDVGLKLSTGGRVCPESGSGTIGGDLLFEVYDPYPGEATELPGFVIIATTGTATSARLHIDDADPSDTTLHALPDDRRTAGIFMDVDTEDLFIPDCVEPGEPVEPGTIELLDDNGRRLPCST